MLIAIFMVSMKNETKSLPKSSKRRRKTKVIRTTNQKSNYDVLQNIITKHLEKLPVVFTFKGKEEIELQTKAVEETRKLFFE